MGAEWEMRSAASRGWLRSDSVIAALLECFDVQQCPPSSGFIHLRAQFGTKRPSAQIRPFGPASSPERPLCGRCGPAAGTRALPAARQAREQASAELQRLQRYVREAPQGTESMSWRVS